MEGSGLDRWLAFPWSYDVAHSGIELGWEHEAVERRSGHCLLLRIWGHAPRK